MVSTSRRNLPLRLNASDTCAKASPRTKFGHNTDQFTIMLRQATDAVRRSAVASLQRGDLLQVRQSRGFVRLCDSECTTYAKIHNWNPENLCCNCTCTMMSRRGDCWGLHQSRSPGPSVSRVCVIAVDLVGSIGDSDCFLGTHCLQLPMLLFLTVASLCRHQPLLQLAELCPRKRPPSRQKHLHLERAPC